MTKAERFNHVFKDKGRYIDNDYINEFKHNNQELEQLMPDLDILVDSIESSLGFINDRFATDLKISLGFIHVQVLGARVGKHEDVYCIGIYSASLLILKSVFGRILANPNTFEEFGDVSKETAQNVYNPNMTTIEYLLRLENPFVIPVNKKRLEVSQCLTHLALKYLVFHENGHIIRGHLNYTNSLSGHNTYEESLNKVDNVGQLVYGELLLMEVDADVFACNSLMVDITTNILPGINKKISGIPFYSCYNRDFNNNLYNKAKLGRPVYLQMFAASTLYRLFESGDVDINDARSRKRPPASIRRNILGTSIEVWIKRWIRQQESSFTIMPKLIYKADLNVNLAFNEISDKEDVIQEELDTLKSSIDLAPIMAEIFSHWDTLKPLLQPNAHMNLGTPPWAWHELVFRDSA